MTILNMDWYATEKEIDPDFEGSIWQELGYDPELCSTCGAHLHGGICLNVCHLSESSQAKFSFLIGEILNDYT